MVDEKIMGGSIDNAQHTPRLEHLAYAGVPLNVGDVATPSRLEGQYYDSATSHSSHVHGVLFARLFFGTRTPWPVVTRVLCRTRSILTLLTTLGEETEVMDALRVGTLGTRSAVLVSIMFRSLYGEESAELAVADPKAWGLDKVCVSA